MATPAAHSPFEHLINPVIRPRLGQTGVRDPALFHRQGVTRCFYTATWWNGDRLLTTIEQRRSLDLQDWSEPEVIGVPGLCSPGNVLMVQGRYVLCCQHYPMTLVAGTKVERHDCRLWLLWSDDLIHWDAPQLVAPLGCDELWSPDSRRQIDPCLIDHDGRFYMLCKQGDPSVGRFGLLVSDDLQHWQTVPTEQALFGPHNVPGAGGVENPMILRDGDEFVCFFAPCRDDHPVGVARSRDLRQWYDIEILHLPQRSWLQRGHNAPCVIDLRASHGVWLMAFHSCTGAVAMSGRIGLAWSADLKTWQMS